MYISIYRFILIIYISYIYIYIHVSPIYPCYPLNFIYTHHAYHIYHIFHFYQYINQFINQSIYLSIYQSIYLSKIYVQYICCIYIIRKTSIIYESYIHIIYVSPIYLCVGHLQLPHSSQDCAQRQGGAFITLQIGAGTTAQHTLQWLEEWRPWPAGNDEYNMENSW